MLSVAAPFILPLIDLDATQVAGQVVFQADQPDFQWNGNSNAGRPLQSGTYVYRATGLDTHGRDFDLQGTITVLR